MRYVTGGSNCFNADRLTLINRSLDGSVKYQVMHALRSFSGFPQHMKVPPPPGTLFVAPVVSTGIIPTASSLTTQTSSPLCTGSDGSPHASSSFLVLAHASATFGLIWISICLPSTQSESVSCLGITYDPTTNLAIRLHSSRVRCAQKQIWKTTKHYVRRQGKQRFSRGITHCLYMRHVTSRSFEQLCANNQQPTLRKKCKLLL